MELIGLIGFIGLIGLIGLLKIPQDHKIKGGISPLSFYPLTFIKSHLILKKDFSLFVFLFSLKDAFHF